MRSATSGNPFFCRNCADAASGRSSSRRREAHARKLGVKWTAFCAVDRPTDHPQRPAATGRSMSSGSPRATRSIRKCRPHSCGRKSARRQSHPKPSPSGSRNGLADHRSLDFRRGCRGGHPGGLCTADDAARAAVLGQRRGCGGVSRVRVDGPRAVRGGEGQAR